MNDRIKQLAEQAGLGMLTNPDDTWAKDFEKFTKLIVREFKDIVEDVYMNTEPEHRACLLEVDAFLDETFGVEE
jgi:hypothetical protein